MAPKRKEATSLSRRRAHTAALAVGGTTWIAPSIVALDRVAAATGSCGTPPVQLDWTTLANTFPTDATAADGTTIDITLFNSFGVADPTFFGRVWGGTLNGLGNPLLLAMENGNSGENLIARFDFSKPVQLCFNLVDVDAAAGFWEDTVEIRGTNAGVPVNLGPADIVNGSANTFLATNTVRGLTPTTSATGNIEVSFPGAIDRLEIDYSDQSTATDFQFLGIHDFLVLVTTQLLG